ncbi:MAG: class I SAM-dependent methyltransferase [Moorea sp. SIO2B7]|nr:class I SAM-dependent methyltransferase [Moorena sp. SIO2B7]
MYEKFHIYQDLYEIELGKALNFNDNYFDAFVSTGVFTRNQVPLNSFEELIRILKPNGIFAVVLRVEDNDFYDNKIKEYYSQNILRELLTTRMSVLKSCSHDLIIVQKQF